MAVYSESPLVSGYASAENVSRISGSAAMTATRLGEGAVVLFADDPNFRAFWYGTEKLYLNALFFSQLMRETSAPGTWVEKEE